jgi:hypothetical protein
LFVLSWRNNPGGLAVAITGSSQGTDDDDETGRRDPCDPTRNTKRAHQWNIWTLAD